MSASIRSQCSKAILFVSTVNKTGVPAAAAAVAAAAVAAAGVVAAAMNAEVKSESWTTGEEGREGGTVAGKSGEKVLPNDKI